MDQQLAEERRRAIVELLVGLRHELNNSLTGLATTLYLLEDPKTDWTVQAESVGRMQEEVSRMRQVITSLPTITEVGATEYVAGITMVDPWVIPKEQARRTEYGKPPGMGKSRP
jgi:signal transduction histidine kinase